MKARYVFYPLLVLACCFITHSLNAQKIQVVLNRIDSIGATIPLSIAKEYESEKALLKDASKIIPQLLELGYLEASLDSVGISAGKYQLYYYQGASYKWGELNFDAIPQAIYINAGIRPKEYQNKRIQAKDIAKICEQLLVYCENNAYPFAKVWLSHIALKENNTLYAQLHLDRQEKRNIDSIVLHGNVPITSTFIQRYLDIAKHSSYNESKLKHISRKIKELPFLQEAQVWELQFRPADTRLHLFLKEKKANQLNALLGLMPNNLQSKKMLLTADIQLALQNYFGQGESISGSFQNLQEKSPRLKASYIQPYLLGSAFGAELHFDLFSYQQQFRKVNFQVGSRYQLSTSDLLKVYYQTNANRVLSIDTAVLLATKKLPAFIDAKNKGIGIEWQSNHSDYIWNPKKGWQAHIIFQTIQRTIIPNNAISGLKDSSGFEYKKLYDTLNLNSYLFKIQASLSYYIPISTYITLKLGYQSAYIVAPMLFQNELYQLGGFKLLRGFDEQSLFANQYHVSITELRLRYGLNSYAYLFSDNGWVQSQWKGYKHQDWYNGFGVGTSLETKSGLFSIALAFGRSNTLPLKFKESKISFGYIALF